MTFSLDGLSSRLESLLTNRCQRSLKSAQNSNNRHTAGTCDAGQTNHQVRPQPITQCAGEQEGQSLPNGESPRRKAERAPSNSRRQRLNKCLVRRHIERHRRARHDESSDQDAETGVSEANNQRQAARKASGWIERIRTAGATKRLMTTTPIGYSALYVKKNNTFKSTDIFY